MRTFELKEYTKEKSRIRVMEAKKRALDEVKKIDDRYWSNKPSNLRKKYEKANRLPMDHPFVIQYERNIGRKLKNDFIFGKVK